MEQWKSQGRLTFQGALKQNVEASHQNTVESIINEPMNSRAKNKSINKPYYEDSKDCLTRTMTTIDHEAPSEPILHKKKRPTVLMNKYQLALASYIQQHKTDVKFSGTKRFCDKSGEYYLKTVLIDKHPDKGSGKILPKLSLREPTNLVNCIRKCNGLQPLKSKANEIVTVMPKNSLTPIPIMNKKSIKSTYEGKELSNAERTAVHIRRLEYSTEMKRSGKFKSMSQNMQAIILIQQWWRSIFSVIRIQRFWRGWFFRKNLMELLENEENLIEKLLGIERVCWRLIIRRFLTSMNDNKPLHSNSSNAPDSIYEYKDRSMLDLPIMRIDTMDHNNNNSNTNLMLYNNGNMIINTINNSTTSNSHNNSNCNSNSLANANSNHGKNMNNHYIMTQPNNNASNSNMSIKSKSSTARKKDDKKKISTKGSGSSCRVSGGGSAVKTSRTSYDIIKKKMTLKEIAIVKSYFNAWRNNMSIEKKHMLYLIKNLKQFKERKIKENKLKEGKLKEENAKKQKVKDERLRKERVKEEKVKEERTRLIRVKVDRIFGKIKYNVMRNVFDMLKQLKSRKVKEKKCKIFENTMGKNTLQSQGELNQQEQLQEQHQLHTNIQPQLEAEFKNNLQLQKGLQSQNNQQYQQSQLNVPQSQNTHQSQLHSQPLLIMQSQSNSQYQFPLSSLQQSQIEKSELNHLSHTNQSQIHQSYSYLKAGQSQMQKTEPQQSQSFQKSQLQQSQSSKIQSQLIQGNNKEEQGNLLHQDLQEVEPQRLYYQQIQQQQLQSHPQQTQVQYDFNQLNSQQSNPYLQSSEQEILQHKQPYNQQLYQKQSHNSNNLYQQGLTHQGQQYSSLTQPNQYEQQSYQNQSYPLDPHDLSSDYQDEYQQPIPHQLQFTSQDLISTNKQSRQLKTINQRHPNPNLEEQQSDQTPTQTQVKSHAISQEKSLVNQTHQENYPMQQTQEEALYKVKANEAKQSHIVKDQYDQLPDSQSESPQLEEPMAPFKTKQSIMISKDNQTNNTKDNKGYTSPYNSNDNDNDNDNDKLLFSQYNTRNITLYYNHWKELCYKRLILKSLLQLSSIKSTYHNSFKHYYFLCNLQTYFNQWKSFSKYKDNLSQFLGSILTMQSNSSKRNILLSKISNKKDHQHQHQHQQHNSQQAQPILVPNINMTRNHQSSLMHSNSNQKRDISSISERDELSSSIENPHHLPTPHKDLNNNPYPYNDHINEIIDENPFVYLKKQPNMNSVSDKDNTQSDNTDFNGEQLDTNANFIQYDETLSPLHDYHMKLRTMSSQVIYLITNDSFEIQGKERTVNEKITQTQCCGIQGKDAVERREICIGTDDEERVTLMNGLLKRNDIRKYYHRWRDSKAIQSHSASPIMNHAKLIEIESCTDTLDDIMLINGATTHLFPLPSLKTSSIVLSTRKSFNKWHEISTKHKIIHLLLYKRRLIQSKTIKLNHILQTVRLSSYSNYMIKWAKVTNSINDYEFLIYKLQLIISRHHSRFAYNKIKESTRGIIRRNCLMNLLGVYRNNILYNRMIQYYTQAKAMTLDEQEAFMRKIRKVIYHNQFGNVFSLIKQRAAMKNLITMRFRQSLELKPKSNIFNLLSKAFRIWKKHSLTTVKSSRNNNLPIVIPPIINIPIPLDDNILPIKDNNLRQPDPDAYADPDGDGEMESSPLSFGDSSQSCHTTQSFLNKTESIQSRYPIQSYCEGKRSTFNHHTHTHTHHHPLHTSIHKKNRRNLNNISASNPVRSNQNFSFGESTNKTNDDGLITHDQGNTTNNTPSAKEFNLIQTKKEVLKPTIYSSQSFYFQKDNQKQQKSKMKLHSNFYSMFDFANIDDTANLKNPRIQAIKATIPVDNDCDGEEDEENNQDEDDNLKGDWEEENEETDIDKRKTMTANNISKSNCNKSLSRKERMSDADIQKNIMDTCYKDINYSHIPLFSDGNITNKRKYHFTFPIKEKTAFHRLSRSNEHTELQKLSSEDNAEDNIKKLALINYGQLLNINKSSNCHKRTNQAISSKKAMNNDYANSSIKPPSRTVDKSSNENQEETFTLKEINSTQFYHSPIKRNNTLHPGHDTAGIYTNIAKNKRRGKMPVFHQKKHSMNSDMASSFLSMTLPVDIKHDNDHDESTENDLSNDYGQGKPMQIRRSTTQSNIYSNTNININDSYRKLKHCDSMSNTARRNLGQSANINLNLNKERLVFACDPPKNTMTTTTAGLLHNSLDISSSNQQGGNIFDVNPHPFFESISDSCNEDLNRTHDHAPNIIQSRTIWFKGRNDKPMISNSTVVTSSQQRQNISLKIKWKQTNVLLSSAYYLQTHKMILLRRMMKGAEDVRRYHDLCYMIKMTFVHRGSFQVELIKKIIGNWKKTLRKYNKKLQGAFRVINNINSLLFIDGKKSNINANAGNSPSKNK